MFRRNARISNKFAKHILLSVSQFAPAISFGGRGGATHTPEACLRKQHPQIQERAEIKQSELRSFARLIYKVTKLQLELFQLFTLT